MKRVILSLMLAGVTITAGAQPASSKMHPVPDLKTFISGSDLPEAQKKELLQGLNFKAHLSAFKTGKTTGSADRLIHYSVYSYAAAYELTDTSDYSWSSGRGSSQYADYRYGELPNVDYENFDNAIGWAKDGSTYVGNWKTIHTFDASGNLIEEVGMNYNASASVWVNSFRNVATYSGSKVTDYISQEWDNAKSAWVNTNRYRYTYTPTDAIATFTLMKWDDATSAWVNNYRYTDTYVGTELQSRVAQNWDASIPAWYNSVYFEYKYAAGLNTGYVAHSWDASSGLWVKGYRDTSTYSGTDIVETLNQTWIATSGVWQTNFRDSFSWSSGLMTRKMRRNWDIILGTWTTGLEEHFTYSGTNMTSYTSRQWNVSSAIWEYFKRADYSYTSGNMSSVVFADWNNASASWQNTIKRTFTFNTNNSLLNSMSFTWTGGSWSPMLTSDAIVNYYYETYTGISEKSAQMQGMRVYPNPAQTDKTYAHYFVGNAAATEIIVTNVLGQIQMRLTEHGSIGDHLVQIPVSDLSAGVYMVQVVQDGKAMFADKLIR